MFFDVYIKTYNIFLEWLECFLFFLMQNMLKCALLVDEFEIFKVDKGVKRCSRKTWYSGKFFFSHTKKLIKFKSN